GSVPDPEDEAILEFKSLDTISVKLANCLRHTLRLRNRSLVSWSLISWRLNNLGSMKLALVEIRLVEITTLVLIKIIPPIEVVLIILMGRKTGMSNLICNHLRPETGVSLVGELTLRIGNEAITYNLDQTSSDFLLFEDADAFLSLEDDPNSSEFDPSYYDPEGYILLLEAILNSDHYLPFGDSDFLLFEDADAFLSLEDDPNSPEFDPSYYDPEGYILLLEAILNSDHYLPSPITNIICLRTKRNSKSVKPKLLNLPLMNLLRLNLKTYLPISSTHFWRATTNCPSLLQKS
nr:hypothetical protein [Tanacetum cinerariifolium]